MIFSSRSLNASAMSPFNALLLVLHCIYFPIFYRFCDITLYCSLYFFIPNLYSVPPFNVDSYDLYFAEIYRYSLHPLLNNGLRKRDSGNYSDNGAKRPLRVIETGTNRLTGHSSQFSFTHKQINYGNLANKGFYHLSCINVVKITNNYYIINIHCYLHHVHLHNIENRLL